MRTVVNARKEKATHHRRVERYPSVMTAATPTPRAPPAAVAAAEGTPMMAITMGNGLPQMKRSRCGHEEEEEKMVLEVAPLRHVPLQVIVVVREMVCGADGGGMKVNSHVYCYWIHSKAPPTTRLSKTFVT